MKITETHLRHLIRSILTEAVPPPDEPSVAPDEALGRYVFPDDRTSPEYSEVPEDYTDLEEEFFQALRRHYDHNESASLTKIWPELVKLNQAGLYTKLLRPPRGTVFRLMEVTPDRAALFMGVDEETIRSKPRVAQVAPSPPPFKPKGLLSSWTMDPETLVEHTGIEFLRGRPGKCSLLFVSDTTQGEFLMHPENFAKGWNLGANYQLEYEVIAGGPVGLKSAAWIFFPERQASKRDDLEIELNEAFRVLNRAEQALRAREGEGLADDDMVRSEEFDIWSEFNRAVRRIMKEHLPSLSAPETPPHLTAMFERFREPSSGEFDEFAETWGPGVAWMSEQAMSLLDSSLWRPFTQDMGTSGRRPAQRPEDILNMLLTAVGEE